MFFEIYLLQENTTGWLSETIPRDLDEKTFIQVRWFCWGLRLNSIQLNPTKNSLEWDSALNFVAVAFFDMKHLLFPWIYIVILSKLSFISTFKSLCYCKKGAMTASRCMHVKWMKTLLWFFSVDLASCFSMYPCHISLSKRLIRIFENLFKFKPPSEDFYRGA